MDTGRKEIAHNPVILYENVKVITRDEIKDAVADMALSLFDSLNLNPASELLAVAVLNGGMRLATDLCNELYAQGLRNVSEDSVKVSASRGTATDTAQIIGRLKDDPAGKTVLLIDEMVDGGNTLAALLEYFKGLNVSALYVVSLVVRIQPAEVSNPVLGLTKRSVDMAGFVYPGVDWLIGYGLDAEGIGRQQPTITFVPPQKVKS
jgi:hypoxanthine phosphoribosyltransferase